MFARDQHLMMGSMNTKRLDLLPKSCTTTRAFRRMYSILCDGDYVIKMLAPISSPGRTDMFLMWPSCRCTKATHSVDEFLSMRGSHGCYWLACCP
eukprot:scaffold166225_cov35-Tisochrysis_lutea.AAC.3